MIKDAVSHAIVLDNVLSVYGQLALPSPLPTLPHISDPQIEGLADVNAGLA